MLAQVERSLKAGAAQTNTAYVLLRDLPSCVAILPQYLEPPLVVVDRNDGLLSAPVVSGGRLKDSINLHEQDSALLRWLPEFETLVPDPGGKQPDRQDVEFTLNAEQIAKRLIPPLPLQKPVRLDQEEQCLVLTPADAAHGAVFRCSAAGFTPLGADFLRIDANIVPNATASPDQRIELYWTTAENRKYDNRQRRVWCAVPNIKPGWHAYYLPLRSTQWVTGGPAVELTFGFPAGATVRLRSVSAMLKDQLMPLFQIETERNAPLPDPFAAPYYAFPDKNSLGLLRCAPNARAVIVKHSCAHVPGAQGVMIEISMPNKILPNPNGNHASGFASSMIAVDGITGRYAIPISSFPLPGLYTIRAIAMDSRHNPLGQFSDDYYCLITTPQPNGW